MVYHNLKHFFFYLACIVLIQICISCGSSETNKVSQHEIQKTPLTQLSEDILREPYKASLYFKRAQLHVAGKDFKNAFVDIHKAIELDSTQADFYALLGDLNFSFNQIPDARQSFEKCLVLDAGRIEALLKLGQIFLYLKQYENSIAKIDRVIQIDAHNPQAYFIKGMNFKEMKDTAKALSSFQTTIEQNPDYYAAYIQLGLIYAKRKNKLAAEYYKAALHLEPKSAEANYNLGLFFQENYDIDAALKYYNDLTQLYPNHKNAWFNLGYIYHMYKKNYKTAISYYTYALRCDTGYTEARHNRELVYELMKKQSMNQPSFMKKRE